MNEESLISEQQTRKPRYRGLSVWVIVFIIGLLALAAAVFMLSIRDLNQRLVRLEVQENSVTTAETLSALQSEINRLRSGLEDDRKSLAILQEQASSSGETSGEITSLHQMYTSLQQAQKFQEKRLDAFVEQLNALKTKTATENVPEAKSAMESVKKSVPVKPAKPRSSTRMTATVRNTPFVLTGVEKRGGEFWAGVAPHGYNSLAQITLIGEGETISGWTLVRTGNNEATFRVNGRLTILKME